MTAYFRRQLADYVEYHRDPRNCAAHVFGIVTLFLAGILPLTLWPVAVFGDKITLAVVMALPVLLYWLVLDAAVGLGILAVAILLFSTAALIVANVSVAGVWVLAIVLATFGVTSQVVGHKVFERRKPSMADHPTHFLLGPPFVMAKLFVALGFRDDLEAIIGPAAEAAAGASSYRREM
jgi:uncharacterized membrane protein YGL010W